MNERLNKLYRYGAFSLVIWVLSAHEKTWMKCRTFSSKSDAASANRGVSRNANVFFATSTSSAKAAEPGAGGRGIRARLFGSALGSR